MNDMSLIDSVLFVVSLFLVFVVLFSGMKAEYKLTALIYITIVMVMSLGHIKSPQRNCTRCICKCEVLPPQHQKQDEEQRR